MGRTLLAGAGRVELPTALGMPMMGYGARTGVARSVHDPLYARALYLERGAGRALIVEVDVCLVGVEQARALRDRIGARTGLARAEILLGCIHTHSGPDTGLGQVLAGRPEPAGVLPLFDAIVEAGVAAFGAARPARLGAATAPVAPGRNRRVEAGPTDPDALLVRVDDASGAPLVILYVHGCHPTVLGHENLAYSADWPGVASRAIERALPGAMAMFVLGAHADVDPRTRGLLDLAVPDQSVGVGFDALLALGLEVGEAIVGAAAGVETKGDVAVSAESTNVMLPTHGSAALDAEGRPTRLGALRADALAALGLPADAPVSTSDLYRIGAERTAGLAPEEARERLARVRVYLRDRTAARFAGGVRPEVEVQVLRLGPVSLLGLPLEVTVDVGNEWRVRAAPGEHARVVSIANGWLRYLPHAAHFEAPLATQQYEILQSTFEPAAAARLVAAGLALRGAPG